MAKILPTMRPQQTKVVISTASSDGHPITWRGFDAEQSGLFSTCVYDVAKDDISKVRTGSTERARNPAHHLSSPVAEVSQTDHRRAFPSPWSLSIGSGGGLHSGDSDSAAWEKGMERRA